MTSDLNNNLHLYNITTDVKIYNYDLHTIIPVFDAGGKEQLS